MDDSELSAAGDYFRAHFKRNVIIDDLCLSLRAMLTDATLTRPMKENILMNIAFALPEFMCIKSIRGPEFRASVIMAIIETSLCVLDRRDLVAYYLAKIVEWARPPGYITRSYRVNNIFAMYVREPPDFDDPTRAVSILYSCKPASRTNISIPEISTYIIRRCLTILAETYPKNIRSTLPTSMLH
jgi:hypothetical protein